MKKLISLVAFILFINQNLLAGCGAVDLTDPDYLRSVGKENLIEHFKSPRDQDSVGWCAAYSASDAVSFATGEPASALDMTISFHANQKVQRSQDVDSSEIRSRGMVIRDVIRNVDKNGYCPESVIPSNKTFSSNLGQMTLFQFLGYFQEYIEKTNKGTSQFSDCTDNACAKKFFDKYISPSIPGATIDLANEVIRKNSGNGLDSLKEILARVCADKKITDTKLTVDSYYSSYSKDSLQSKIDDGLDKGIMPTISVSTSVFAKDSVVPGGHGLHGMVVIGKKMGPDGKCQYKIRNSWGKSCFYYRPEIADCDEAAGTFWLNESQLKSTLAEVTLVKSSKKIGTVSDKPDLKLKVGEDTKKQDRDIVSDDQSNRTFDYSGSRDDSSQNDNKPIDNKQGSTSSGSDFSSILESIFSSLGTFFSGLFSAIGNFATNFWDKVGSSFNY
jgi:hypothetical protein